MRIFVFALLAATLVAQAPPDLNGVWKADPARSQIQGPPGIEVWLSIEQTGSQIQQRTIASGPHFEVRSNFKLDTSAPQTSNSMRGVPVKNTAKWDGASLKVTTSFTDDGKPRSFEEAWTLNSDGTLTTVRTGMGPQPTTMVWVKQPASAAEIFTRPERKASEVFQNVKVLDMPASQLIPVMEVFSKSLGARCDFCHVPNHFEKDDKPEKVTARKMVQLAEGINHQYFGNEMRVTCYTCHRGAHEPPRHPPE